MAQQVEVSKEAGAEGIVRHYMLWSMGAGLIPIPLADMAAVAGVQIKMLSELASHYDVEFSEHRGKSILSALVGGIASRSLAAGTAGSILKAVPLVGTIFGMVAMPIFAGATTYAVGKVFLQHFAAGGTLLDFQPETMRSYFEEQFAEGRKVAADAKAEAKKA